MSEAASVYTSDVGKVAVLMGGDSAEREISLLSGKAVLEGLKEAGLDAVSIDPGKDFVDQLRAENIDRVFIILHGRKGEDGKIQAVMEQVGIPYTGSGVLACALSMDKTRCKKIWLADELPTPAFVELNEYSNWNEIIRKLGTVFVKPVREGSSLGISRADSADELQRAWALAREYDDLVMAEQWIDGKEFTVSILEDEILPIIQLKTGNEFYDFNAKYESQETLYLCPPELSESEQELLKDISVRAYRSIGCHGWGRVDVMQDSDGRFWLLEINTVPGMTEHSLVPIAAKAAGMTFSELVLRILQSSRIDRSMD